jgi:hypothetical protein
MNLCKNKTPKFKGLNLFDWAIPLKIIENHHAKIRKN